MRVIIITDAGKKLVIKVGDFDSPNKPKMYSAHTRIGKRFYGVGGTTKWDALRELLKLLKKVLP